MATWQPDAPCEATSDRTVGLWRNEGMPQFFGISELLLQICRTVEVSTENFAVEARTLRSQRVSREVAEHAQMK